MTENEQLTENEQRYRALAETEATRWSALVSDDVRSWSAIWDAAVARHPSRIVVEEVETGAQYTYAGLDALSRRVTAWALAHPAPAVGVLLPNGAAILAVVIGLTRAGVPAILFNPREPAARHALLAERTGVWVVLGDPIDGVETISTTVLFSTAPFVGAAPVEGRSLDDTAAVIFTSGTTGPSKGARFPHRRLIGAGVAWALRAQLSATDRCYIPLPLCHGNALAVAFAAVVESGGRAVVRRRFSVSAFREDIERCGCTAMVYIGELWRYLLNSPPRVGDDQIGLRVVFGNGLTGALWRPTLDRWGIRHVVEHYGATEMPAGALTNWMGREGACGYLPPGHRDRDGVRLVHENGETVPVGEAGEIWLRIGEEGWAGYWDHRYDAAKRVEDPISGEVWWRSGDRLREDAEGFFTFIERLGDGFRYKGENVSASEVEAALVASGDFDEVVVYGMALPSVSGAVGVGSVRPRSAAFAFSPGDLAARLGRHLAPWSIPRLLCVMAERHETTATLKISRQALAGRRFDIDNARWFVLEHARYLPLSPARMRALESGEEGL
ncbi:MAG: AMP-binding protein [Myxococcota bacterium]